jgi:hypothetical protein
MNLNKTGNARITQTEPHSCNHCCHGKAIITAYAECVAVTISIHHAMHIHRIVICNLPVSTIFSPSLKCTTFEEKYY